MTEVNHALNANIGRDACQILGAAHIHCDQVRIPSLRLGTGQMKDHVHILEGGTNGTLVRQTDNGYFHGESPG